jgi:hypothetical protein
VDKIEQVEHSVHGMAFIITVMSLQLKKTGIKRPGREVDHSPLCIAEVKNECRYTSAPHVCLHAVDRHNFTFYLVVGNFFAS